jgi:hypothetical protein
MRARAEDLQARARRAYERGRFRRALPVAIAIPPVASLAFVQCAEPLASILCALVLALLVAALLHRGQDWGRGARAGLVAGMAPFAFPIVIEASGSPALCELLPWFCAAGGICAGLVLAARRRTHVQKAPIYWIAAALVAGLAGAVGCLIAGAAGLMGLAVGLAIGAAPALVLARA